MAFHHLRTLCQLLMIVLYADAVKAFSPVLQESVSNGAPDFSSLPSWGDGFLSSQFSDDALHSSAASPAESFFDLDDDESDNHDLGVVDEGDILDYNGLSPRAQRPPKGKRPKQKPVAGKPLPSTPQLREPLLESQRPHQTEDAGHPTQSREKGPSQRPTSPPGMDRPVPNISAPLKDPGTRNGQSPGDHHISTGIHRFPPVAKQPLSSWVPSRRKPAVYSPQSARRVPGFAQGSARRPSGFPEQNGLTSGIRRPPFSHFSDHVERPSVASDVTWGRADVAYSPYAPPSASRLPLSTYGTADRRGPRIGPYGLVHGDYGRPLEGQRKRAFPQYLVLTITMVVKLPPSMGDTTSLSTMAMEDMLCRAKQTLNMAGFSFPKPVIHHWLLDLSSAIVPQDVEATLTTACSNPGIIMCQVDTAMAIEVV
ncbi:hypothetical protein Z043_112908 [Scleropages formosus]|uniref:Uncharacterized protein n=1 Tax=Scleropages formosus TaxID=113540 RepID=A0A0P7UJJ4_SCLFO|nr:hypothetical protein Z043_112908 [Scleropages formosus]